MSAYRNKMPPILGYWKMRGLAQAIRIILKFKEVEFEDKYYPQGDPPGYCKKEWYDAKYNLGLDLPNLPYYIDDNEGVRITETSAIIYHLGRKYGLLGSTEQARVRNDMAYSFQSGNRTAMTDVTYSPDFEKLRDSLTASIVDKVQQFSTFLGSHQYCAGNELTVSDFCVYDLLDVYRNLAAGCIKQKNVKDFMTRIESLPTVKAYMASDKYMNRPFNSRYASWGATA